MERYSLISEKYNKSFNKNLNVEIQKYRIFHDNESNFKFIQIKVSNYSSKNVEEVTLKVTNLETIKDEYILLKNLSINPNTSYSTEKPIYFKKDYDSAFAISIFEVKNSDNSLFKNSNNLISLNNKKALFKRKINYNKKEITLNFKPVFRNTIWRCGCGFVNKQENKKCLSCDLSKEKVLQYHEENKKIIYSLASIVVFFPLLIQSIYFIPSLFSDFIFSRVDSGYALTGYRGTDEVVSIPSEHRGRPVTEINNLIFSEQNSIREIIIPETVKNINRGALSCLPNLEKLTTPLISNDVKDGLTNFYDLFLQNPNCIDLFNSHNNRKQNSYGVSVVPKSMKILTISKQEVINSFEGLATIEVINLGSQTKEIVNDLHSMTSLMEINIDPKNEFYASAEGVMYTKNFEIIVHYPTNKVDEAFTMGNQTRVIPNFAFGSNSYLKELFVSESVVTIDEKSFEKLKLRTLEIPFIGLNRDSKDSSLNYLFGLNIPSELKDLIINDTEYVSAKNLQNLTGVWNISFSSKVKEIEFGALDPMVSLKSINFINNNSSYKTIDGILYSGNGSTLVKLPQSKFLTEYKIPDGVTMINANAIKNNIYLNELTIPNSVSNIEESTLSGLQNLRKLTLPFVGKSRTSEGHEGLLGHVFGTDSFNFAINVKQVISFNEADEKFYYIPYLLKEVVVTDSTRISFGAFSRISILERVKLNEGINTIESFSFFATINIKAIELPDNLVTLGDGVFQRSGLETIFLPKSLINQGFYTFTNSNNLKEIRVEHNSAPSTWDSLWNDQFEDKIKWGQQR